MNGTQIRSKKRNCRKRKSFFGEVFYLGMACRCVVVLSFYHAIATVLSTSKTTREAKQVIKKNHHKEKTVEDSTRSYVPVFHYMLGLRLSRPLPYCEGDLHIHSLP